MSDPAIPGALQDDLRAAWHRYVDLTAPLRPALHAYCRRLTGNLWDAEDLVQEALEQVLRIEERDGGIARLRGYAFCPETMRAIGDALDLRVRTGLYRYPTPAPGQLWSRSD